MKSDAIYEDCVDFLVGEELKDGNILNITGQVGTIFYIQIQLFF